MPRFIFIDHDKMQETKDILWSKHVKVVLTDAKNFKLTTSRKVYTLKAITGTAREWKDAIEKMLANYTISHSLERPELLSKYQELLEQQSSSISMLRKIVINKDNTSTGLN